MSERISIHPRLFQWAQQRSRKSEAELCAKFPKYPEWLSGEARLTMRQLEDFAGQTYTLLGYLFLPEPPEERLPIQDFRTVTDRGLAQPSPHLAKRHRRRTGQGGKGPLPEPLRPHLRRRHRTD